MSKITISEKYRNYSSVEMKSVWLINLSQNELLNGCLGVNVAKPLLCTPPNILKISNLKDKRYTIGRKGSPMACDVGKIFLSEMDNYISQNFRNMTCNEMYNLYFDFFNELKKIRCNSNGFNGFSEFIIFRYIYHALGGNFSVRDCTKDLNKFVSNGDEKFVFGQSIPITIEGKKKYPDISIQYNETPISVVAIKTYLVSGRETINNELINFTTFREKNPKLNALLLIFWDVSKRGVVYQELEKLKKLHERNNYLILQNNDKLLLPLIEEYLKLEDLC